jgi:hypothetical protein
MKVFTFPQYFADDPALSFTFAPPTRGKCTIFVCEALLGPTGYAAGFEGRQITDEAPKTTEEAQSQIHSSLR